MSVLRSFPPGVAILAGLAACSSHDSATVQLTLGGETTTFTQAPAVTDIVIQALDSSGTTSTLGSAPVSATTIALQSLSEADTVALEARGFDAQDAAVVFGATIPLSLGQIVGDSVPIFVGRINQFARAPNPFVDSRQAPLLAMVQGQYMFVAGGTLPDGGTLAPGDAGLAFMPIATTQLYDFGEFQALASPPTLGSLDGGAAFGPQSLAMTGTVAWLVSTQGGLYLDLSSSAATQIAEPAGTGSFAAIAGGATVSDAIGTQTIVGGTRVTGAPTTAVLEINPNDTSVASYPDGNVAWLQLSTPRLGAAATWVSGRGIVVAAGSATGAGVEVLSPATGTNTGSSTAGAALAYPADPSVGAGATAMPDGTHLLLAGGVLPNGQDAGVRLIDLSCTSACAPVAWTSLPIALGTASAYALSSTSALVVGNEPATGVTHAFLVTGPAGTATEVLLPTYQDSDAGPAGTLLNARTIISPMGTVIVFGGYGVIESFQPQPL